MNTLKNRFLALVRRLISDYPSSRPLVYVCSRNGVTAVVRADAFDAEVRSYRAHFEKHQDWPLKPIRPMVFPVFLFGPEKPQAKEDFRTGSLDVLKGILQTCAVEERSFWVPDAYAEDMIPVNYPYADGAANIFESTKQQYSARFKVFSLERAIVYLVGRTEP